MENTLTEQSITSAKTLQTGRLMAYGAFFSFFLFGFIDNLKGPTLPALLGDLKFGYAQGGTIVSGAYIGFLIATLLTGPLANISGKKTIMLLCCVCWGFGTWGYITFNTFALLTGMMFMLGFGSGAVEVGANLIIIDIYKEQKGKYLNLLAFFHGVGSMIAPLYAGQLLANGVSWRSTYQYSLVLVALLSIYTLALRYPRAESREKSEFDLKAFGKSAFSPDMILFYIAILLYVAAEVGVGAWLVDFLQNAKSKSVMQSSLFLSLFFAAITIGRFIGSFLVDRIGYIRIMLYASIGSIVCLTLGIFGPTPFAWFLPLTGLFFSIVFPTITAAVSDLHRENVGTIFGMLFAFAGLGGAVGPWVVGMGNDMFGLQAGFGMTLAFCTLMALTFVLLLRRK